MGRSVFASARAMAMARGLSRAVSVAVLALALCALGAGRADARAQPSAFTWTGTGIASIPNWSNAANWGDESAPSGSETSLTFPDISSCDQSNDACFDSEDDVSGLSAGSITLDDAEPYQLDGSTALSLGSGGLTAQPSGSVPGTPYIQIPLSLTADQQWSIGDSSSQTVVVETASGTSAAVGIDLSGGATLDDLGSMEVGTITATGDGTIALDGATLDNTDPRTLNLEDAVGLDALPESDTTGPITSTASTPDTTIDVGEGTTPDATLTADGAVTLDSDNALQMYIDGAGQTPGSDYSQLTATGAVTLGGANLMLAGPLASDRETDCPGLNVGDVYTLVSRSSLTGTFANAPAGTVITLEGCSAATDSVQIGYTPDSVTATVVMSGPSFTWSGGDTAGNANWSDPTNWVGGDPPGDIANTLTFPALTSPGCTDATDTCTTTSDDREGLSVNELAIDTASGYVLAGEQTLTLGGGGIVASSSGSAANSASMELPLALSASQTWALSGGPNQQLAVADVTDAGDATYPLALDFTGDAQLDGEGDVEVGDITAGGSGDVQLVGSSFNGTDGNAVDLDGGVALDAVSSSGSQVGALDASGSDANPTLVVGDGENPDSTLAVDGALTLGSDNVLQMYVDRAGTSAGSDFSQITVSGPVDLGGARLLIVGPTPGNAPPSCPSLHLGDVYQLIEADSVTGTFGNAAAGTDLPISGCGSGADELQISYGDDAVTATVVQGTQPPPTATATSTTLSSSTSSPVTDQPVTLTATVSAGSGTPSGSVVFTNSGGAAIAGCSSQPLSGSGSSLTAICVTSFAASSSPESLVATFAPSGSGFEASASSALTLGVAKAATSTALASSSTIAPTALGSTSLAGAATVTYTATVTPAQSGAATLGGTVQFLDAGNAIASCSSQPLSAASATCTTGVTAGAHAVTAVYSGDGNFDTSVSSALTTPVAATLSATVTSTTSATLMAIVTPGSSATTAIFRYGLTTSYGSATPAQSVGSGTAADMFDVPVTGLLPNSTYHFRVLAGNPLGATYGDDVTFTTPADPPPPPPVLGKAVNVMPVTGTVFIKLPGANTLERAFQQPGWFTRLQGPLAKGQGFIPLTEARQIPVGSQVDARKGTLKLISASTARHKTYSGDFGAGLFEVLQARKSKGLTTLKLLEGSFPGAPSYKTVCASTGKGGSGRKGDGRDASGAASQDASAAAAQAVSPAAAQAVAPADAQAASKTKAVSAKVVDLLKSDATGQFQTMGRYSSATVRGTKFETIDQCNGTLTKVQRGVVSVHDLVNRRTVTLTSGKSFLAKPRA